MRPGKALLFIISASMVLSACNQSGNSSSTAREVTTYKDKVSYAIGLDIGKSLKQQSLEGDVVDLNKMKLGIEDAMGGAKPLMTDSQISETMMSFQKEMMARTDSLKKVKGAANETASREFLEKNGKEAGVVTLPSGLQYKVITEGKGPKPTATNTVTVHYAGTLLDGTEFDSSIKRGQPATFPVSGVIKGWTEALQLMNTGSKWKLFIPPALGYGENGAGQQIGPNATLVFEVELLAIADGSNSGMPSGHP
jgi:FKBP-type peptidyl-prolyl cis-trans isomerase FklB